MKKKPTTSRHASSTYWLGAAAILASALMAALFWPSAPALDAAECSLATPPRKAVAVLIDRTDPMSKHQIEALHQIVAQELEQADVGTRFLVYALDRDWNGLATPIFEHCRPARKASETDSGATDVYLSREWVKFKGQIDSFLDNLLKADTAPTSPIFEAIKEIARDPRLQSAKEGWRLILVTDALQNTAAFRESQNAGADFSRLKSTAYFKSLHGDLSLATADIFYLQRPLPQGNLQTPRHQAFFRDWLSDTGATVSAFTPLPQ